MTGISKCSMSTCAYNKDGSCHTMGITVGPHAECNTYVHASKRGGFAEVSGAIGACLASSCKFNTKLECEALKVDVATDEKHADCATYQARKP
ncbi:MAG: DUF1540 domain-containing protein [Dehalococcoidales bacterium]|nr:DUF1540 domain-containing protein [Dehalococcoidales bacterium]